MKHAFTILLTACILMIIGVALIPGLDISNKPRPRQGKTLTIAYQWPGASAKIIEQNVTSRIEGLVSSVKGVESVTSVSNFGLGTVTVQLKKGASVSGVKFEIASLLRQVKDKLPKEVSHPILSGGEVVTRNNRDRERPILSYRIKAAMPDRDIRQIVEQTIKPRIERLDGVGSVDVSGGTEPYVEIAYKAQQLALYGLTAQDVEDAIRNFLGREDVIGEIVRTDRQGEETRTTLFLAVDGAQRMLETIPLKNLDGKIIYLNHLATCLRRDRDPNAYYRINGLNTVYMNVRADRDANISRVAALVKNTVEKAEGDSQLSYELTYDKADEEFSDFRTLIVRSAVSLLLLLIFVFLCKRDLRYLFIIFASLVANLLIAIICYRLFDLRLQPYSLAGITVSLGLIIDATIVMVDHYSYHRDFKAYFGIVGATLTTVGALLAVFWLPDHLKIDLYEFSWVIIINLCVALLVSALFVPALVSVMGYSSRQARKPRNLSLIRAWNKVYGTYLNRCRHRLVRPLLLAMVAGAYGWSVYLFVDTLDTNAYEPEPEEMKLHIRGQMPIGGTASQLNEKVRQVETFLSQFKQIKRYVTSVESWGADISVEFKPAYLGTTFPYTLENKVIGKFITIGGADWSTWGVSQRGFSNSLNLQYRSSNITLVGYEYDRLYRYAEDVCNLLRQNNRVQDITIETPEHERQEDEYYMIYDKAMLANDSLDVSDIYGALSTMLAEHNMGKKDGGGQNIDYVLRPEEYQTFDLWQLQNAYIKVGDRSVRLADLMAVNKREAKNSIPRENQEYVFRVAFNVLGSYNYTTNYIKEVTQQFNAKLPIGFRCINSYTGNHEEEETQYWLIALVVVVIFFICAILFESLRDALIIVLLIPVSLIGPLLTFHFSGIEFGTGGFAALVLLCGLTVNNGIYMVSECRHRRRFIQAYNHKIIPILLTVLSTILGFVPFLTDGPTERFWFPFAVGAISGLVCSVIATVLVLPLLTAYTICKNMYIYNK